MAHRHILRQAGGGVRVGYLGVVIATIKQGVVRPGRVEAHAIALHIELIAGGRALPQNLVIPHTVGEAAAGAEVVIHRIQPIVDGVGVAIAIGELSRIGPQGNEEAGIPVEVAGNFQIHGATGRRQRLSGGFRQSSLNSVKQIVVNGKIIQGKTVGRVGIVDQHAAIEGMTPQGLRQHGVLNGDVIGIGDLHRLIRSVAHRHVIDNGIAGVA